MEWQCKLELTTEAIHRHFINVCAAIDRMLNCDGDVNANFKCEQVLKLDNHGLLSLQWPVIRKLHGIMAHFHQGRRTRIRIPNPIVTLYYAQLFRLVRIRIPVWIVSQMVTVPILGTDLHPRNPNPNLSPLVEMSHYVSTGTLYF